jgi:hypothetical protein
VSNFKDGETWGVGTFHIYKNSGVGDMCRKITLTAIRIKPVKDIWENKNSQNKNIKIYNCPPPSFINFPSEEQGWLNNST